MLYDVQYNPKIPFDSMCTVDEIHIQNSLYLKIKKRRILTALLSQEDLDNNLLSTRLCSSIIYVGYYF